MAVLRPAITAIQPNPCNPRSTIHVQLPDDRGGTLQILNAAGRRVWTSNLLGLTAGPHAVEWKGVDDAGRAVASGAYVVVLQTNAGADVRRITVVK
jgi:flagellar hook assembly protein FlgD